MVHHMTYKIQLEFPCENPEKNVRVRRGKKTVVFYVPVNHPRIHKMGIQELSEAARFIDNLDLSTHLNTETGYSDEKKDSNR